MNKRIKTIQKCFIFLKQKYYKTYINVTDLRILILPKYFEHNFLYFKLIQIIKIINIPGSSNYKSINWPMRKMNDYNLAKPVELYKA